MVRYHATAYAFISEILLLKRTIQYWYADKKARTFTSRDCRVNMSIAFCCELLVYLLVEIYYVVTCWAFSCMLRCRDNCLLIARSDTIVL